jgi:hypothetical protein
MFKSEMPDCREYLAKRFTNLSHRRWHLPVGGSELSLVMVEATESVSCNVETNNAVSPLYSRVRV